MPTITEEEARDYTPSQDLSADADKDTPIETIKIDDKRYYKVGEDYLPSVTTILTCYPKGPQLTKWIAENGWEESQRLKNLAGEKGTIVHNTIEDLINGQEISYDSFEEDEWRKLLAFQKFWEDHKPETVHMEHTVVSLKYCYAGTIDWSGIIDGKMVRIDWKTSKNLWPEYDIQLAAYEMAEREAGLEPAEELWVVQFGTSTKKGYSLHKVKDPDKKFEAFKIVKKLWDYVNPNAKPFEKSIPLTISI